MVTNERYLREWGSSTAIDGHGCCTGTLAVQRTDPVQTDVPQHNVGDGNDRLVEALDFALGLGAICSRVPVFGAQKDGDKRKELGHEL